MRPQGCGVGRVVTDVIKNTLDSTACRFDRQNGHIGVMLITRLERLIIWNYWQVM